MCGSADGIHPPRAVLGDHQRCTADRAADDAGFYIVVQSDTANLAHGDVDIAEMTLTIRYLVV